MPVNARRPEPPDYSADLLDGRRDLQADAHAFFGGRFPAACTLLDIGSGQGRIKERVPYRTTTYDIDRRLGPPPEGCGWVDAVGADPPAGPFDLVTAFDVIEHVEDDLGFLRAMASRAARAAFLTTPNWHVTHCNEAAGGSTHHWREYNEDELVALAMKVWSRSNLVLFAFYKDAAGGWWELPRVGLAEVLRRKHGLLWCASRWDRDCILMGVGGRYDPRRTPA